MFALTHFKSFLKRVLKLMYVAYILISLIVIGAYHLKNKLENDKFLSWQSHYPKLERRLYDKVILECRKNNVGPEIIFAIIHSESRFNQYALSVSGAIGFMQLMPKDHLPKGMHKSALYDLDLNIEIGVGFFGDLMRKYKRNVIQALNFYERGKRQDVNVKYLSEIWDNLYGI